MRHSLQGPAVTGGGSPEALPPPTDDEILQLLAKQVQGGLPTLQEITRDNVRIVKEKIADYVDPPRTFPRIGGAQLHHAHYKCTVYGDKTTKVVWPVAHTAESTDAEVLYVDHYHLHIIADDVDKIIDGGQTLPSPYYLQDDVQYFPHEPEFKLAPKPASTEAPANAEQTSD